MSASARRAPALTRAPRPAGGFTMTCSNRYVRRFVRTALRDSRSPAAAHGVRPPPSDRAIPPSLRTDSRRRHDEDVDGVADVGIAAGWTVISPTRWPWSRAASSVTARSVVDGALPSSNSRSGRTVSRSADGRRGSRRLIGKACERRRDSGMCRRVEGHRARGGLARTREFNRTRRLFRHQRAGSGHEFWPVLITISVCRPEQPRGLSLIYPIYCRTSCDAVDVILKKRDGRQLSREEIQFFVAGVTDRRAARLPGVGAAHGRSCCAA